MIARQRCTRFNLQLTKGRDQFAPVTAVPIGAATTGSDWRFLKLSGSRVEIDMSVYYLRDVERIVGVLLHMLSGEEPRAVMA